MFENGALVGDFRANGEAYGRKRGQKGRGERRVGGVMGII